MTSSGRDDQADPEDRKADEEPREDAAAMKVTEQADNQGGVHNQEPGSLHPEAGSPVQDAHQVQNQCSQDQEPSSQKNDLTKCHGVPADPLPERQRPGTASATIVPGRPTPCQ